LTIHWISSGRAFSAARMAGKATLTTEPSMKARLEPSTVAARISRPRAVEMVWVSASAMAPTMARHGRIG
jgi:hypothetical protein